MTKGLVRQKAFSRTKWPLKVVSYGTRGSAERNIRIISDVKQEEYFADEERADVGGNVGLERIVTRDS